MHNYQIFFNKESEEDLKYIGDIIYNFSLNKEISENILKEILLSIYSLSFFPYRYQGYKKNIRILIYNKKYKIFYEINENNKKISILRILFSKQNYKNLI